MVEGVRAKPLVTPELVFGRGAEEECQAIGGEHRRQDEQDDAQQPQEPKVGAAQRTTRPPVTAVATAEAATAKEAVTSKEVITVTTAAAVSMAVVAALLGLVWGTLFCLPHPMHMTNGSTATILADSRRRRLHRSLAAPAPGGSSGKRGQTLWTSMRRADMGLLLSL